MRAARVENLWQYIQSLPLSVRNQEWLAERLLEKAHKEKEEAEEAEYISKEEILEDIRQGLEEVKLYREGKLELKTLEEALHEL